MLAKRPLKRKEDFLIKTYKALALISWIIAILIFSLMTMAKPTQKMFVSSQSDIIFSGSWNMKYVNYSFYLLILLLIICIIGLYINSLRHGRKRDTYNSSLIFFLILSSLGIVGYFVLFVF